MTRIRQVGETEAKGYIKDLALSYDERVGMEYCLYASTYMWVGTIDERLACIWGLIPPTILSNQAYLWLYTTDVIEEHQFVLVRHSQLVMETMLEQYSSICGHAVVGNDKAIRWLKWLGAKFGEPYGGGIPFRIRRNG